MVTCFNKIATDSECRVVVLSGAGKIFTAGKTDMYFQQFNFLTFASHIPHSVTHLCHYT
jgi:enoyl-CoA hydratase/carnithine racemase